MFRTLMVSIVLVASTAVSRTEGKQSGRECQAQFHVRIYNYAQVPPDVLTETKTVAHSIFRKIGVEVFWSDHSFDGNTAVADHPANFQLRILSRTMAERLPVSKTMTGLVFQGLQGQAAAVANVFYHRVEDLAKTGICTKGEILGHAVAHELGHLLLGNIAHSSVGLMKAQLGHKELQSAARGDLVFTVEEAALIQRALAALPPNPAENLPPS